MSTALLEHKYDLIKEVFNITKDTTFVGDENDSERYIELMEKRTDIFERIYALDSEIESEKSTGFDKDVELNKKIKIKMQEIIDLDNENQPFIKKAKNELKHSIKNYKTGKNLNKGYAQYVALNEGMSFDTKN